MSLYTQKFQEGLEFSECYQHHHLLIIVIIRCRTFDKYISFSKPHFSHLRIIIRMAVKIKFVCMYCIFLPHSMNWLKSSPLDFCARPGTGYKGLHAHYTEHN